MLAHKRARKANQLIPDSSRAGRICDIACGWIPFFLMNTRFKEKYGIEPRLSPRHADRSMVIKNINLEDDPHIPFESDYFDIVTMLAAFEHIERTELQTLMREIYRVLKPGGFLILTTPSPWTAPLLAVLAFLGLISPLELSSHKKLFSKNELYHYCTLGGFQKSRIKTRLFEFSFNRWLCAAK